MTESTRVPDDRCAGRNLFDRHLGNFTERPQQFPAGFAARDYGFRPGRAGSEVGKTQRGHYRAWLAWRRQLETFPDHQPGLIYIMQPLPFYSANIYNFCRMDKIQIIQARNSNNQKEQTNAI